MSGENLSTEEVARILECIPTYVTLLVKRGHFPGTYKFDPTRKNSVLSIPKIAVEEFIKSQVVSPGK
jgi:hypothetical protein